jgi:hypothetical protein
VAVVVELGTGLLVKALEQVVVLELELAVKVQLMELMQQMQEPQMAQMAMAQVVAEAQVVGMHHLKLH